MDAVNNLSDAMSAFITVLGIHLATRPADKEHPFGHGRTEYISALIVAFVVLYAGVSAMLESIRAIINPTKADYSIIALIVVSAAILVKIILGIYYKKVGTDVDSGALVNSGVDALNDAVISSMTLVAAIVYMGFKISVEPYLAAVISLMIIKSGVDMIKDTLSTILGESTTSEFASMIKSEIKNMDPRILGAYDLVIHDYGPESMVGSVHIEIPDTITVNEIDSLSRKISRHIMEKYHLGLSAIGVYSFNTGVSEATELREIIMNKALTYPDVLEMHGFYVNDVDKEIRLDLVMGFAQKYRHIIEEYNSILNYIKEIKPGYDVQIGLDRNFSNDTEEKKNREKAHMREKAKIANSQNK
ncbi:MAG: cation transporter, partial [Lachnospiraceae bacterium]|nr:cation transporter [Lachnospiraceae bacterium]